MATSSQYERTAVFIFGVVFVTAVLTLAVFFPTPSDFQYTVFRIVLALAAAGVAAFVPGFLDLRISNWLRAGGAMAVFAIVYFYSPARLVYQPKMPQVGQELRFVTESMTNPSTRKPRPFDLVPANTSPIPIGEKTREYKIYFTTWNQHPYEKLRISSINYHIIDQMDQISYCCPETRSLFEMKLRLDDTNHRSVPLMETVEIPPSSSHTFVAKLELMPGNPDRDPIMWVGIVVTYSAPDGVKRYAKSDKVFLVNTSLQEDVDAPYDENQLLALGSKSQFLAQGAKMSADWLGSSRSD